MNADPKHKGGYDDVDRAKVRAEAPGRRCSTMPSKNDLPGASEPNSGMRNIGSDKMPMTRPSAPGTTRAPIRCSASVAIATSKAALGSIVTTPLPFLDRIFDSHRSPPSAGHNPYRARPGSYQPK